MVEKVTDKETLNFLERKFKSIFKSTNPLGSIFHQKIQKKILLYNADYSLLINFGYNGKQELDFLGILSKFISEDETIFLSMTETVDLKDLKNSNHWIIKLNADLYNELNRFHEYVSFAEQAIYSSTGEWGMIVSKEEYILLGGKKEFLNKIDEELISKGYNHEFQLSRFLSNWKENAIKYKYDISWIPKMLENIYGIEKTREILKNNSFSKLLK